MTSEWPDAMVVTDGVVEEEDGTRTAWCSECRARRTFSILPDEEVDAEVDEDWVYWSCDVCQGVPDVCPWPTCGCGGIIDCARLAPRPPPNP